jgi:hypothetical protein
MPLFVHWRQATSAANDAGRGDDDTIVMTMMTMASAPESTRTSSPSSSSSPPNLAIIVMIPSSAPSRATTAEEEEEATHARNNNNNNSSDFFCSFDTEIETRLRALHARQRLHGDVQHEIDTYLVACISPQQRHLILPRNNVPHYDNLPDISAYAIGILDPTMDSDPELQQVLLLLRQCTPLRRRTKRAQREVHWREESLFPMQTLVRCMQGTLLGLYPNCLKAIAFGARVGILRVLRTLLVQPFAKLHACMQKIPYIVKLAVMEHLCNTIYDFHPGVCHTLNRSGQKVEHFCNTVSTICDIFRGELNTLFCASAANPNNNNTSSKTASAIPTTTTTIMEEAEDPTTKPPDHGFLILKMLQRLEKTAHSYFERCFLFFSLLHTATLQTHDDCVFVYGQMHPSLSWHHCGKRAAPKEHRSCAAAPHYDDGRGDLF